MLSHHAVHSDHQQQTLPTMTRNYRYKSTPSIHDSRLTPYDILCGRTSHAYNNVGNRRFRVTIRMFLQRYQMLHSRADRKVFIFYLTKLCREEIGFRFLKEESGDFHDIGEVETRKKIVSCMFKSSLILFIVLIIYSPLVSFAAASMNIRVMHFWIKLQKRHPMYPLVPLHLQF